MTDDIAAAVARVHQELSDYIFHGNWQPSVADVQALCDFAAARLAEPPAELVDRTPLDKSEPGSPEHLACLIALHMPTEWPYERQKQKGRWIVESILKQFDVRLKAEPPADLVETARHAILAFAENIPEVLLVAQPLALSILTALAGRIVEPGMVPIHMLHASIAASWLEQTEAVHRAPDTVDALWKAAGRE